MNYLQNNNRNGVTLLFVVSMIVLFLLMGTAFMVASNDFLQSAKIRSRITTRSIESLGEHQGQRFVEQALFELLRGPDLDNVNSPMRGQSILADMYGYGMTSYVKSIETELIQTPNGGRDSQPQFIRLELIGRDYSPLPNVDLPGPTLALSDFSDDSVIGNDILRADTNIYASITEKIATDPTATPPGELPPYERFPQTPGRFNGQLLTFASGAATGLTGRIVDHQVFTIEDDEFVDDIRHEHRFVLMLLDQETGLSPANLANVVDSFDDGNLPTRVVINGRAFAGVGAGVFDPDATLGMSALSFDDPNDDETNVFRNQVGVRREDFVSTFLARLGQSPDGSAIVRPNAYSTNEGYDAIDRQNAFLAGFNSAGEFVQSFAGRGLPTDASGWFPSADATDEGELSHTSTCSRNFPSAGVDQMGSGQEDCLWMDLGIPVFTNRDGRRVKPMVCYTVLDLDSKLNINAHGNRSQLTRNMGFSVDDSQVQFLSPVDARMTPGLGWGPAEVNLHSVFGELPTERLLVGDLETGNRVITPGRYGSSENDIRRLFGGGPVAGRGYVNPSDWGQELFSAYQLFDYPQEVMGIPGVFGEAFQSSPLDVYGRFRHGFPFVFDDTGIVPVGMPVVQVGESTLSLYPEIVNSPYEANLAIPSIYDRPFTPAELESLYRRNDSDLVGRGADRISVLAGNVLQGPDRGLVTTDSWEVPTLPQEMIGAGASRDFETLTGKLYAVLSSEPAAGATLRFGVDLPGGASSLDDLEPEDIVLREEVIQANLSGFFPNVNTDRTFQLDNMYRGMLAADIRAGRKFDINRPFGDGIDNSGTDNIVDNPGEEDALTHPNGTAYDFDYENDGIRTPGNSNSARQVFARQLYILTLLATELVDRNGNGSVTDNADFFDPGFAGAGSVAQARLNYRRAIAQWAINVADFRDADATMSPFEVDLNPWDGWDVDGDFTTDESTGNDPIPAAEYATLWGTERPELLITENLNIHDRRLEEFDIGGPADGEFDTRLLPNASAFFELYNPSVSNNQIFPAEFDASQTGVDLSKTTKSSEPVWRVVVANSASAQGTGGTPLFDAGRGFDWLRNDPHESNANGPNLPEGAIRRYVYFTAPPTGQSVEFDGPKAYAPVVTSGSLLVEPGGYAVAGSSGINNGNLYTTYLGRRVGESDDSLNLTATRRIELDPSNGMVTVVPGNGEPAQENEAVAIPLASVMTSGSSPRRSFGTTDPVNGYFDRTVVEEFGGTMVTLELGTNVEEIPNGDGFRLINSDITNPEFALDEPIDQQLYVAPSDDPNFWNGVLAKDQLVSGVFVLMLQRLANPEEDWDPVTNPYRTVDSTAGDVLAFNGAANEPNSDVDALPFFTGTNERRPNQQMADGAGNGDDRFRTLWKTDYRGLQPTEEDVMALPVDSTHFVTTELVHSLGRINQAYVANTGGVPTPFAWLTWNNRPFANAYELTLVPYTSSYFLTSRFDTSIVEAGVLANPYEIMLPPSQENPTSPLNPVEADVRFSALSGEFPHLLNFHAEQLAGGGNAPQLYRLFDYVEVPSPYAGTRQYLNPADFYDAGITNAGNVQYHVTRGFAPPFDYVSNFRDPGKININTISNERVWNALMGEYAMSVDFAAWRTSLADNPVRSPLGANRVDDDVQTNSAETNLFRRAANGMPLLDLNLPDGIDPANHTSRNAFFKYHMRNRLANLTTNRSSVFAIWITVGYFEVETAMAVNEETDEAVSIELPGAEIVDEIGRETRNRGFFIFDRSIPVAFEPGRNHNIERAIRVSSFIE